MKHNRALESGYDVIVLGAGAAGMTAAFVAAHEGLRVLLVEKAEQVGGSTSRAAGTAWIPGNFSMDAGNAEADIAAAHEYLNQLVGERTPVAMRETFLREGPAMLNYMQQYSSVRFQACPKHSDYYPELAGARTGGRPVEAVVFDGRTLGEHFDSLKPPLREFMVLGGMMVSKADIDALLAMRTSLSGLKHALALLFRYGRDRLHGRSRGTRLTMGNALCGRLLRSIIDAGVTLRTNVETSHITRHDDGGYVLTLTTSDRSTVVRCHRGLIFAGGGFSANAKWRERYMPAPVPEHTVASEANDASTLELALGLGGVLGNSCEHNAWWFPSSVVPRREGAAGIFPHIVMDRAKPGLIAVDRCGRRFVNEGMNYHEFSRAQYLHNAVPCWLICDRTFIRRYGLGAIRPGSRALDGWVSKGYVHRATTLQSLAEKTGIDAEGLRLTIERMAHLARTGEDVDFGKGSDHLSRQNGDPSNTPNPCLGPIETAPFFAIEVAPADLGTSLGLQTNEQAQLLDANGDVLLGLYACGNDMNSVMGGQYPAPGVSIGPAMTFAYLAALHLAHCTAEQ